MLKKVRYIAYGGNYAYAPPDREGVVNTEEIASIVTLNPGNTRRPTDDQVRIRFRDGGHMDVLGKPEDFLERTDLAWGRLRDLPPGMVFVTEEGILAVKTKFRTGFDVGPICIGLENGETVQFAEGDDTLVRAIEIKEE